MLQSLVLAVVDGEERVTVDVVEAVAPDAVAALRERQLNALSGDFQTIYDVIANAAAKQDAEGLRTSKTYQRYCTDCSDHISRRTVTTYLGKLVKYGLVEVEGRTRSRRYHAANVETQ